MDSGARRCRDRRRRPQCRRLPFHGKAGNVEAEQSLAVWIDKTSPEVVFAGSLVFQPTDSAIGLAAIVTDALSGVKSVSYKLDGAAIDAIDLISLGEQQGLFKNHGAAQSLQSKIQNIANRRAIPTALSD